MNPWENFIKQSIINGNQYPAEVVDPIIDLCIQIYRRNQFTTISELVEQGRKQIEVEMRLKNKNLQVQTNG